ncbi:hypothetical protein HYH02_013937 [Chlamydomonas schloesseri]|uniref:Uncharacterized protein n=1 Tax=Chlamydomonas schloesseri TaxID=2026947 RepID=A0A835VYS1_9CHLO|nr:hypothetical protein HYH02_013937 [Chlamydomonas schloesseri]|eukprot:KAG2429986.1 hypothetical protein HYH02_013937 [Chlamydomonas schloesseri]
MLAGRADGVTGQRFSEVVEEGEVEALLHECNHWINTPQFSKEGEYVAFIYRFGVCRPGRPWFWRSFQFLYHMHTDELWRVPLVQVSHQDWGWGGTFLVSDNTGYWQVRWKQPVLRWEPAQPRPWVGGLGRFGAGSQPQQQLAGGGLAADAPERLGDGHASYGPGAGLRFVLSDTYPRKSGRTLFITDTITNTSELLGRFDRYNEGSAVGDHRVDLHPRWDRTGRHVCFDSTHEGSRQVYVARTASVPRLANHPGALLPRRAAGRYGVEATAAVPGGGGGGEGGAGGGMSGVLASRRVVVFGARQEGFVGGLVAALEEQALAQYTRLHVVDHRAVVSTRLPDTTAAAAAAAGTAGTAAASGVAAYFGKEGARGGGRGLFSMEQIRAVAWVADDPALDLCAVVLGLGTGPGGRNGTAGVAAAGGHRRARRRGRVVLQAAASVGRSSEAARGRGDGGAAALSAADSGWWHQQRRRLFAGGGSGGGGGGLLAEACRVGPVLVRAMDAGAWLSSMSYLEEWVECYFDGSARTPNVVTHMVLDGSIALCDQVNIAEPHGPSHGPAAAAGGGGRDAAVSAALDARRAWREAALTLLAWLNKQRLIEGPPTSHYKPLVQNSWNLVNDRRSRTEADVRFGPSHMGAGGPAARMGAGGVGVGAVKAEGGGAVKMEVEEEGEVKG